jgi:SAM-dependent methyltransferase
VRLEERACALCGPDAPTRVRYPATYSDEDFNARIFSARRTPDRRHFQLVECATCGMVFSNPAGDPAELTSLSEQATVDYAQQEDQIYDSYAPVLDQALPMLKKRGTFLEIGGGRGFMLRYGHEHGFAEQVEVEPSEDAEQKFEPVGGTSRFVRDIFKGGLLPADSVSLACFFQILDHVPHPLSFLEDVHDVLEPGGVAVSVTHNTRAVSARVMGEKSPIFDIEHMYLFHPRNLSALYHRAGFSEVRAFPIANNYSFRHWLNMAPLPQKHRVLQVAERTGVASVRMPLRVGNFAVVARKG